MTTLEERLATARRETGGTGMTLEQRLERARTAQAQSQGGFADTTETIARGMVRGIPVAGPMIEGGIEWLDSLLSGKTIADVQARGQQLQQQNPTINAVSEFAGGVAGSAAMVAAAPTAFGAGGGGLLARTLLGAGSGAAVGAADSAARGGDALQGAVWGAGGGAAGTLAGSALGRAFARRGAAPTSQALKAQAGPLFEQARSAGVVIKPAPYQSAVGKLATALKAEGLDPVLHPKATRALVRLQEAAGAPAVTLDDMTTLRRIVGAAAGSADADERRIARIAIDHLDDFMQRIGPSEVFAGDPAAVNATLREARQLWTRGSRAEIIEEAMDRAVRAQAGGTVTEGTAIRAQFRRVANNKALMRKFGKPEQAAIRAVAKEDRLAEALKLIGGLRSMVIGGVTGSVFGPVGSGAITGGLMTVGLAGRAVAGRSARQAAATVQELTTTGAVRNIPPSATGRLAGQSIGIAGGLEGARSSGEAENPGAQR